MVAYYNEIDPYAAQWLRNLISSGQIAPGEVDERDIRDVKPQELSRFHQCHFFAGIGVWSHVLRKAGVSDEERIWTGSCPCQPFSAAGSEKGFADERHLWPHWNHLIEANKPTFVFGEQVASKNGLEWADLVSSDLQGKDYFGEFVDICAAGDQAPHIRQRLYFGFTNTKWNEQSWKESCRREAGRMGRKQQPFSWDRDWESALRFFRTMDDGSTYRVVSTDAARNAIVSATGQKFVESFFEAFHTALSVDFDQDVFSIL